MRLWCDAMWGIMRRDAILFVSYRTQLVAQFLGPLFTITLFYYISHLLTAKSIHSPGGYFGFVIIGLVIVQILTISLGVMPVTVRQELVSGTIERFLVSAHGPINGILGTMLFPLINALFSGMLMLALAALVFGLPLASTAVLAIPRGAARHAGVHAVRVLPGRAGDGLQAGVLGATQFIVAGVAIVGGLYFPIAVLPGWIRWASEVQPFTPATDLLRHLLVDAPLVHPARLGAAQACGLRRGAAARRR